MRSGKLRVFLMAAVAVLMTVCAAQAGAEEYYYGIEIGGVLCGYSRIETSPLVEGGEDLILIKLKLFLMLSALGSEFNTDVEYTCHVDPATGRFTYHDSNVEQGQVHLDSKIYVEGNEARCTSSLSEGEEIVELPPDVTLENALFYYHIKRDFVDGGLDEKSYEVFEVREQKIQTSTYTKAGLEKIELAGKRYDAVVVDRLSKATGLKARMWIDTETGMLLKSEIAGDRMSYLADESVVKMIELASVDYAILSKVDVAIADVPGITYMKVKVKLEPTGLWITPESLNVPGQSFTGTVEDNLIKGVFEIEHPRYDGGGAPPFPHDFSGDESLKQFLEPGDFIESDDPVLAEKAKQVTEGSKDSWEALCRLSEWVADNIGYAIPGGGTPRKTYDTRAGECGAHSLLLASFCRSVGIPARLVWGCMYTQNLGGSFGQHAWNEIYMGDAGWIPVDATAMEIDFVDSGHIRIGVGGSSGGAINPGELEILDYRVRYATAKEMAGAAGKYDAYVGEYSHGVTGDVFKVVVRDGGLAIDFPNKLILGFSDPDEEGIWYCKMSRALFCAFAEDDSGMAVEFSLHELVRMQRQSDPEEMDEDVPDDLRPYLGEYLLGQANAVFEVLYEDGGLAIHDPLVDQTVKLQPPDEKGGWLDEFDKNTIYFERDDEGNVTSMTIDSTDRFERQ